jgi:hypothetical protein
MAVIVPGDPQRELCIKRLKRDFRGRYFVARNFSARHMKF